MNSKKFECSLGFHEYTIPAKLRPHILLCKHCKRFGYYKSSIIGFEYWTEHDNKEKMIHYKDNNGYEAQWKYNNEGLLVCYKNNKGYEKR